MKTEKQLIQEVRKACESEWVNLYAKGYTIKELAEMEGITIGHMGRRLKFAKGYKPRKAGPRKEG